MLIRLFGRTLAGVALLSIITAVLLTAYDALHGPLGSYLVPMALSAAAGAYVTLCVLAILGKLNGD